MDASIRKPPVLVVRSALFLLLALDATCAAAQGSAATRLYPEKPVRIVSPSGAGSANDTIARLLGKKLSESWGQPVVIENRPGASGIVGAETAARSPADGYTVMLGFNGNLVAVAALHKTLPYDTLRDFAPVSLIASIPGLLAVHPSVPVKSVKELIALATAKPAALNYASYGAGSGSYMAMELFKSMARVDIVNVSYKSSVQAVFDLIGGQVHVMQHSAPVVFPHVQAGKLRALGVSSSSRWTSAPDIPTVAEAGVPGYELSVWFGVVVAAKTDPEIVQKLSRDIAKSLQSPDVRDPMRAQGFDPVGSTPDEFSAYIKSELERYFRIVKTSGIKVE